MDDIGLLVKALIRENPHDLLIENHKYLQFANEVLEADHSTKALDAAMEYTVRNGRCPESIDSLLQFLHGNRYHISRFEKTEGYDDQIRAIEEDEEDTKVGAVGLINDVYQKAHDLKVAKIYAGASKIATGGFPNPNTKERGPAAADDYIKEEMAKVVVKSAYEVSGELIENLDYIEEHINSYINGDTKRVFTGFKKIDEITLIGRKQRNKWIGILGYTHHGKSLLLSTLLYNMACNGANIMLVPRESSVEEAWMTIIWLHHKKVCPERPIAERAEWMRIGAGVGIEKYNTIQMIIKDLREGTSIPGKFVVEPCKSWYDIEEKLHLTNKKYNFDVLAIDYFAHLDTSGGNKRDSDMDKYKKDLRKAQMLSMNGVENDQTGLVVITPLQANRKGYEAASNQEGDRYGIYENANAVEYFTQAAQDMDMLMSVWFEGDACKEVSPKQMLVHCLKARGNMIFPTHRVEIHPDTGYISDIDNMQTKVERDRTMESLSDRDMEAAICTTTTIDTENWEP